MEITKRMNESERPACLQAGFFMQSKISMGSIWGSKQTGIQSSLREGAARAILMTNPGCKQTGAFLSRFVIIPAMQSDPSLPPEPLPLTEASVQEIQLELMRRKQFNSFDGPKIVASLRQHRSLWRAVLMDRSGGMDLIKLRDLPDNYWNVDELFIMTDTYSQAYELQRIAEEEQW